MNANKEVNAAAKSDKDAAKSIETEDDYRGAVDNALHFGLTGIELEDQGYSVNQNHFDNKWDKTFDRINREGEKLNR